MRIWLAIATIAVVLSTIPMIYSINDDYLTLDKVKYQVIAEDDAMLKVEIKTAGKIIDDGVYGYVILTDGLDADNNNVLIVGNNIVEEGFAVYIADTIDDNRCLMIDSIEAKDYKFKVDGKKVKVEAPVADLNDAGVEAIVSFIIDDDCIEPIDGLPNEAISDNILPEFPRTGWGWRR